MRTSGENLFVVLLVIDPSSQELGPPTNPARFKPTRGHVLERSPAVCAGSLHARGKLRTVPDIPVLYVAHFHPLGHLEDNQTDGDGTSFHEGESIGPPWLRIRVVPIPLHRGFSGVDTQAASG
ncbi:hypothetical protein CA233_19430 [Sphingomonas sp. ABOLD]|nr:hypothetical protein CA233_19430 [Sphingomonas sp. ABOLD]